MKENGIRIFSKEEARKQEEYLLRKGYRVFSRRKLNEHRQCTLYVLRAKDASLLKLLAIYSTT